MKSPINRQWYKENLMLIHELPLHDINIGVSMVSVNLSPLHGHPQVVVGGTASNMEGSCKYIQ